MFDAGTTAFMAICAMLVLFMTPGLAFFYGGLSRRKNVLNTMAMTLAALGVTGVLWVLAGWSFAYGGDGSLSFFGGFDQIGLVGVVQGLVAGDDSALSHDAYPAIVDIAYQLAFASITAAIITGAVAGRMKFGAVVMFLAIWSLVVYAPLAHMVWGGEGSLVGDVVGALDFAGGDVVHISSGLTGLVLCLLLGGRRGFGAMSYRPHNVPFVVLGASILWFGWFGFNAGSAFAPDGVAALALLNTAAASAAGLLSWMLVERVIAGKPTVVGAASGLVAGLVAITPAAGFVEPWAAVLMGMLVSPACYFAIGFCKARLGYDDALDAFGVHCVGGILGGVLTGILCVPELSWTDFGGLLYTGDPTLLVSQVEGIAITVLYVGLASLAIGFAVKALFKGSLRVDAAEEARGLDIAQHGESAYPAYLGLD